MIEVAPSAIHGQGLFTTEPIVVGALIMTVEVDAPDPEGASIDTHYRVNGEPCECLNEARYINTSDTPNAAYSGMNVVAIQDIQQGDEITVKRYVPLPEEEGG